TRVYFSDGGICSNFPIVVAVRLSLSFPILLSALPLYTVDRTLDVNKEQPTHATRVYFSDGGICSNFPMHFFDAALPTRPTFGVNLKGFHPDHPDERVWLPELLRNNQGLKNYYPPLSAAPGIGSVAAFLWSIVNTMQNWRDQLQLAMPGFRDRIVHVSHSEKEGGLNLNMEQSVISILAKSGAEAAEELINAFAIGGGFGTPNAWDNHQRIRIRTLLSQIEQQLKTLNSVLHSQQNPTYEQVVLNTDPPSYKFPSSQTPSDAAAVLQDLQKVAAKWDQRGIDFVTDAPRPSPEMRIVPRM
ncbi:patatin-like phospholipase family protein, partial [bacterium]|nr:patatin-like phospholipase family protein [bacterium]